MTLRNIQAIAAPKEPVAGPLYAWGNILPNVSGSTSAAKSSPAQVGSSSWIAVASGENSEYGAAIRADGALFTWGVNTYGAVGQGPVGTSVATFVQVGSSSWTSVFAGKNTIYAVDKSGSLYAWGNNAYAGIGAPSQTVGFIFGSDKSPLNPVNDISLDRFGDSDNFLAAGSAAVATNLYAIGGDNNSGQLGTGAYYSVSRPVTLPASYGSFWAYVKQGGRVTIAVDSNGNVWAWGAGYSNGNDPMTLNNFYISPAAIISTAGSGLTNRGQFSVGRSHAAIIGSDSQLRTWGYNSSGQLGDNTTNNSSYSTTSFSGLWNRVACGDQHTAAIKTDGTLWTWGDNTAGQLGVFTAGSGGGGGSGGVTYNGGPFSGISVSTGGWPSSIAVLFPSTTNATEFAAVLTVVPSAMVQIWYQNTLYMFSFATATVNSSSVEFTNFQNANSQYSPNSDSVRAIAFKSPSSISNYSSGPLNSGGQLDISFMTTQDKTDFQAALGSTGQGILSITIYDYQYTNQTYLYVGLLDMGGSGNNYSVSYNNLFTTSGSYPGLQIEYVYIPNGTTASSGGGGAGGSWTISDVDWSGPTASVLGIFFGGPTAATDSLAFKEALISGGSFTIAGALNSNQNPPSPYISADVTVTGTPNYQSSSSSFGIVYWFSGSFTVNQTGGSPGASTVSVTASSGGSGGGTPTTFTSPHIYYDGYMFQLYFSGGADASNWNTFASASGTATITYQGLPYTMTWTGPWTSMGQYSQKTNLGGQITGLGNIADQYGSFSVTYTAASSSGGTSTSYTLYTGQSSTGYLYQGYDNYIDNHTSGVFYFAGADYQTFLSAAPATFTYDNGQTIYSISGASGYSYGGMGSVSLNFGSATPTSPGSGTPKITVISSGSSGGTTVTKTLSTGSWPSGFYSFQYGSYQFQGYFSNGEFYFNSSTDADAVASSGATTFTFNDSYGGTKWSLSGVAGISLSSPTSVMIGWTSASPTGPSSGPSALSWTSAGGSSGSGTTYTVSGGPYGNGFYSPMYGGNPGPNGPGNGYIYFSSSGDASAFLAAAPTTFDYNDGSGPGSKYTFIGVSGLSSNGPTGVQFSWTDYSFSSGTSGTNTVTLPASSGGSGDTGADVKIGNASSPVQVGTGTDWAEVSAGYQTTYATKTDGTLWSWGSNAFGQLGHGSMTDAISPVQVDAEYLGGPGTSVIWISAGMKNVVVGTNYGIWGVGSNANNHLGPVGATSNFTSVDTGYSYQGGWAEVNNSNLMAYTPERNYRLYANGSNNSGQYGLGNTISGYYFQEIAQQSLLKLSSPVQVLSGGFKQVAIGGQNYHRLALTQNGVLYAWGDNSWGQTRGDGWTSQVEGFNLLSNVTSVDGQLVSPVRFSYESWAQVAAGDKHTLGIRTNRTLWAWGSNDNGQLGIGISELTARSSMVQVGSDKWLQVAATSNTSLGIKLDGTLWSWGASGTGAQGTTLITTPYSWSQISAGQGSIYYTGAPVLAIRSDGLLFAWGRGQGFFPTPSLLPLGDTYSRNSPVQVGNSSWTTVSTGQYGGIGIDASGRLWNWGLADNNTSGVATSSPVQVGTDTDWVKVSAGAANFAIKSNGQLWGWGARYASAGASLGNGSFAGSLSVVQIPGSWTTVKSTFNGDNFGLTGTTVGIQSDGTLWTWGGIGNYGTGATTTHPYISRLGDGTQGTRNSPAQIGAGITWAKVDINPNNIFAISSTGRLYGSGDNQYWQLPTSVTTPTYSWTQVSVGLSHTLAISSDGGLWAWGYNSTGQVGLNNVITRIPQPTKIGSSSWTQVAAGYNSSFAIRTDGTLWAWGDNTYGKLGLGNTVARSSPVQVGTGSGWTAVATNQWASMGLKSGDGVLTWGSNNFGLLGDSQTIAIATTRTSPQQAIGGDTYQAISLGWSQAAVLTTSGALYVWGNGAGNALGQGNDINSKNSPVQIAGTWQNVSMGNPNDGNGVGGMAIKSDSTLWAWGTNTFGQLGLGDTSVRTTPVQVGTSTYQAVSRQGSRTVAVTSGGTLMAWGSYPFTSTPAAVSGATGAYTSVLSGNANTHFVRKSDGTLWVATSITDAPDVSGLGNRRSNSANNISTLVQIGNNPVEYSTSLVPIGTDSWSQVSAGYWTKDDNTKGAFVAGIKSDGTLWTWGSGTYGQLGTNTAVSVSSPVQVGTSSWSQVTAHHNAVHAVKLDGTLWGWGYDINGALGLGLTQWTNVSSPVQIGNTLIPTVFAPNQVGTSQWKLIVAVSGDKVMGIKLDGTAWSWGTNVAYSNGLNSGSDTVVSSPVQFGASDSRWLTIMPGSAGLAIKRP